MVITFLPTEIEQVAKEIKTRKSSASMKQSIIQQNLYVESTQTHKTASQNQACTQKEPLIMQLLKKSGSKHVHP